MQGQTQNMPVTVRADIAGGKLKWAATTLPLPIKGSGEVSIAYLDDSLRVLCSRTGTAVQIKQPFLQELIASQG